MAELITFRCARCQHVLKIGTEKAGRKAKCPKCGEGLTVPGAEEEPVKQAEDDEDDASGYGLADEPVHVAPKVDLTAPIRPGAKDEDDDDDDKPGRIKLRKREKAVQQKTLLEPEKWQSVKLGLQIIGIGYLIWLLAILLHLIPFWIVDIQYLCTAPEDRTPPDYATPAQRYVNTLDARNNKTEADLGDSYLGTAAFAVNLMFGSGMMEAALWLWRIAEIFMLITVITLMVGAVIALPVPPRFGTKGIAIALISVGAADLIIRLVFKLLPLTGVMNAMLWMYVTPEVAMAPVNMERMMPLQEFWSDGPFWECFFSLIFLLLGFVQPLLFAAFLRAIGLSMKNDDLDQRAKSMLQLAAAQGFMQICYFLIANTGTSDVLVILCRVLYVLATCFFVGQLIWFSVIAFRVPAMIEKELTQE